MLLSLYKSLLGLYPDSYQKQYRSQMIQTMDDLLTHAPKNQKNVILLKEVITTPFNAFEQYLVIYSKNRGVSARVVLSLVSFALLLPFLISLVADEMSELLTGGHLYTSWLWSTPILFIWIVLLPLLSLILSFFIYLISIVRQKKREHTIHFFAKRYWLTILTFILSAGILGLVVFHDSVHCWFSTDSLNKIVTCTEQNMLTVDGH